MNSMFPFFFTFFSILFYSACVSSNAGEKKIVDGEEVVKGQFARYDPDSIPPELWSVEQRRATAGYYFLLGEFSGYNGQIKDALTLYQSAYNLDPNSYLGTKMTAAKASMGDFAGASAEAERLILLYPNNFRLRYLYGSLLASHGRVDDGVREFRRALELKDDFEPSYLPIIDYEIERKNYKAAHSLATRMTEKLSWSTAAWLQLARINLIMEKNAEALIAAKTAYDLRSDNLEVALLYAATLEANQQPQKALQIYEQMYFENAVNDELLARIVELYGKMGDLEEVLTRLQDLAATSEVPRPGIEIHRALILEELRRFDEALVIYQDLLASRPEDDRVKFLAGRVYERVKQLEKALKLYESIAANSSLRVSSDIRRAVILNELGRTAEAEAVISPILKEGEMDPKLISFYATVLSEQGKFDKAIEVVSDAYKRWPEEVQFLFLKGVYQERSGDINACIATMREVIKVDPKNSSAYNYLGYLFVERKENLDEAEKLIQKALELKPGDGYYLDSLGWLYYHKGEYQKALETLQRADKASPGEGVILEHIAEVYRATGNKEKSVEFFRKAIRGRLEDKERALLLEKMKKYGIEASQSS